MKGKDRALLRSEAHHLDVMVHVGKEGLSPNVINSLDDALRTRELVKIQVNKGLEIKAKEAAEALALATNATIVQVIGRTATLYRENPDLEWKSDSLPPWRR